MLKEVTTTCMDISQADVERGFGHIPEDKIYEWAAYQAALSVRYASSGEGISSTPGGELAKKQMMDRLKTAFETRGYPTDWQRYEGLFAYHLEDPGTLENFRYFCVPDSDEMMMFYVSIWSGDMASAMEYLHRYGKDLKGEYRESPKDEAWYQMTEYEGIAVNERLKAQGVANIINYEGCERICFFGGGNLPERLYDYCLCGATIVSFETGITASARDLAKAPRGPEDVDFLYPDDVTVIKENLLQAYTHQDLLDSMDLVVMHGVSMYLGKSMDGMIKALNNGKALLVDGGKMSYDYLLLTDGMRRTATAQHWPKANEMKIFGTVNEAISEGVATIEAANEADIDSYFDIDSIIVNSIAPWGETSVRFVLKKHI